MFTVVFIKYIFDTDSPDPKSRFAVFERQEQLPFPPSVGLEFRWITDGPYRIVSCTWHFDYSRFWCKLEDEFPDNVSLDGLNFEELLERAQSSGWPLVKVYDPE